MVVFHVVGLFLLLFSWIGMSQGVMDGWLDSFVCADKRNK
jgi:hypothetical protein